MTTTSDFAIHVEDDELRVRFVSRKALGALPTGHATGGDYASRIIRLRRSETRRGNRAALLHELGHYLVEREELNPRHTSRELRGVNEEDICDLLTWVPIILADPRNGELRAFMGIELVCAS